MVTTEIKEIHPEELTEDKVNLKMEFVYKRGADNLAGALGIPVEDFASAFDKMIEGKEQFGIDALITEFQANYYPDNMKFLMLMEVAMKLGQNAYMRMLQAHQAEAQMKQMAEQNPTFFKEV